MQPTQFPSWATYIGNHPSLFATFRQAKTSAGQILRQNPQALHISSEITTSRRPAGALGAFFSSLNSGYLGHHLQHDVLGVRDVRPREALRGFRVVGGNGLVDAAVLAVGVFQPVLGLQEQGMEVTDGEADQRPETPAP